MRKARIALARRLAIIMHPRRSDFVVMKKRAIGGGAALGRIRVMTILSEFSGHQKKTCI
jgi:hypothetical protein